MKARISTEWLSGCSGCHVAVVDLHEKLLNLVEDVEFVRVPVLMDEKEYPEADIGIVEGAVRSEHDRHVLEKMRASVKFLVAFGTCAVYGGPSGLGWLYDREDVLKTVYGEESTVAGRECSRGEAPRLEESVVPIDEIVNVDLYLPGCPPHPFFIAAGLRAVLGGKAPPLSGKSVCSECDRRMEKRPGTLLLKGAVTAEDQELCLLSQGVLCLGSVTLNRCQAPCPNAGVACTGCAGPRLDLILEPQLDIRTLMARRLNMLTGIETDEIIAHIEENAKTVYAYALSSRVMYGKPTVELNKWAVPAQGS